MNNKTIDHILENGIIAIARGIYGEALIRAVGALADGGVRAVEVTFEQHLIGDDTFRSIIELNREFRGEVSIGAGTVMTLEQLKLAYGAGAEYIVSPNTNETIIRETKRLGMVSIPGAMTPTEIANAASFGADIVKVFPAGSLGPEYFAAIKTPLSHIKCAAVGGITLNNIASFRKGGACAFGISSSLFDKKLIESGELDTITKIASEFVCASLND